MGGATVGIFILTGIKNENEQIKWLRLIPGREMSCPRLMLGAGQSRDLCEVSSSWAASGSRPSLCIQSRVGGIRTSVLAGTELPTPSHCPRGPWMLQARGIYSSMSSCPGLSEWPFLPAPSTLMGTTNPGTVTKSVHLFGPRVPSVQRERKAGLSGCFWLGCAV